MTNEDNQCCPGLVTGGHLIDVTLVSEDNQCCPVLVTWETFIYLMYPWYLKITSAVQGWSLGQHLINITLVSEDNQCCPGLVTGETPADEATGAVLEAARAVEGKRAFALKN